LSKLDIHSIFINSQIKKYTVAFSKEANTEFYQIVKEYRNIKYCIQGLINIITANNHDDSFFCLKLLNAKAFLMGQIALNQLSDTSADEVSNLLAFINRIEKRANNEIKSKLYNRG
jgi:uncharacterized protein YktA (UPF0223 family)